MNLKFISWVIDVESDKKLRGTYDENEQIMNSSDLGI